MGLLGPDYSLNQIGIYTTRYINKPPAKHDLEKVSNLWERDRERAQARTGGKGSKGKDDGLTPEQRRERDAKALQEKTAKKAAQAAGGESSGGKGKNDKK
ncbi:conserved hypothetical protein [Ricinus communis]|uniref:Small EDRK-rich factor-like N-terminal domain-containing protein n=1 Tax=Ricinus communis TaxID=3988 RepID=B9RWH2_RICCO|nr:conserved hypothetical protein [Ricinus communis]